MKKDKIVKNKELYIQYIEDVAWEISIDNKFREQLLNMPFNKKIEISQKTADHCSYLRKILSEGLVFFVEKVHECPEDFDDGLTIFKFSSKDFSDVVRYTGNNL